MYLPLPIHNPVLQSFIAFVGQEAADLSDELANFHLIEPLFDLIAQVLGCEGEDKHGRYPHTTGGTT